LCYYHPNIKKRKHLTAFIVKGGEMGCLDGKVAIVTGAGQGLGAAIAELFAKEGAKVVGTGRTLSKVENAFAKVDESLQKNMIPLYHDVANRETWKDVIKTTLEKFGRIDILVNNAAVMINKPFLAVTEDDLKLAYDINTIGAIIGIQEVAVEMEKVGGGSVINVASIGALVSGPADGGDTAYSASKGGLTSVTRNAAIALADKKIRVNSLHPGGIMTPMLEEVFNAMPDLWESNKLASPLPPHISDPIDIAGGALYLASDLSKTVTGTKLVIDCGYMAR
jgi:NAD(P)-dependent dehydrogenase (short-subunit alcohol dehydrogenase family)